MQEGRQASTILLFRRPKSLGNYLVLSKQNAPTTQNQDPREQWDVEVDDARAVAASWAGTTFTLQIIRKKYSINYI